MQDGPWLATIVFGTLSAVAIVPAVAEVHGNRSTVWKAGWVCLGLLLAAGGMMAKRYYGRAGGLLRPSHTVHTSDIGLRIAVRLCPLHVLRSVHCR